MVVCSKSIIFGLISSHFCGIARNLYFFIILFEPKGIEWPKLESTCTLKTKSSSKYQNKSKKKTTMQGKSKICDTKTNIVWIFKKEKKKKKINEKVESVIYTLYRLFFSTFSQQKSYALAIYIYTQQQHIFFSFFFSFLAITH